MSVYVPNIDEKEALELASTIVEVIPSTTDPQVTISAGLITWDERDRPKIPICVLHADTALYEAKNSGKNRFVLTMDRSKRIHRIIKQNVNGCLNKSP